MVLAIPQQGECNQALVEKGTSQLGVLRTFIGDLPCREEDMLDAMASEHTTSVRADTKCESTNKNIYVTPTILKIRNYSLSEHLDFNPYCLNP